MLTRQKNLNPHENSCSKVISILITGNILHESSSAPQQHKSVQYKWFTLYLHPDVSHTNMLQPHFFSCRGVSGARGNMRGSRNFCQLYLVLILFYSLQRGPMVLLLRKLYLYFTKDPEGVHYFTGRGGGGPYTNFLRNPYAYLLFSRGGVRTPYPPLDPHMGNVIITGQYLSQSRF